MYAQVYLILSLGLLSAIISRTHRYLGAVCFMWYRRLHATVLDENYLVGRRLLDSAGPAAGVAGASGGGVHR